jgi:galactokinase
MLIDDSTTAADSCLDQLRAETIRLFKDRFSRDPKYIVAAPGRVNVIGEHTDYNGGYVLPMAIERYVIIAAGPSTDSAVDGLARIFSAEKGDEARLRIAGQIKPGSSGWASYVQGVIAGFAARGPSIAPFDAAIRSTVPLGGGLSSSAALEVATATLLEAMLGQQLKPTEKALLCQEAEHKYAGVPCGIMDQFSSTLCRRDHLMLLDCRSQDIEHVPFTAGDISVLITNSNVKHELTGGEYAKRRAQCDSAAKTLGVETLRDACPEQLESARPRMDDVSYRRARHVITEIDRTAKAAKSIRDGRWHEVGQLMYASHASLRDDYEVSCPELDRLVEIAHEVGESGGVIGSRMTGGGFGGCTVTLVKTTAAPAVIDAIRSRYQESTGITPTLFTTRPAQGAQVLSAAERTRT